MTNLKEVCVIGAGFHAKRNIYPSLVENNIVVKAVATRSKDRSIQTLTEFGFDGVGYDDYKLMLKEVECNAVVVITQAEDAVTIVKDCILAKKNVFCDKPLGLNLSDAKAIDKLASENGVYVMVGFMKRFSPIYTKLSQIIKENTLGEVCSFRAMFAVDCSSWNDSKEGYVYGVMIHYLDLIRHLFGEVQEIRGFSNGSNTDSNSFAISIKFETGIIGVLSFENHSAWTREYEGFDVTFEKGFVRCENTDTLTVHHSKTTKDVSWESLSESDVTYTVNHTVASGSLKDLYLRGFVGEFEYFASTCMKDRSASCNTSDNVLTMLLCELILKECI